MRALTNDEPGEGIYVPKYRYFGTPFILVRGQYHKIADIVIEDFSREKKDERIGVNDYLETWGILDAQSDIEVAMDKIDEEQSESQMQEKRSLRERENTKLSKRGGIRYSEGDYFLDFKYYSKPPDIAWDEWEAQDAYFYYGTEGSGVNIYMVDSGFAGGAEDSDEFKNAFENDQVKEWIYAHGPMEVGQPDDYVYDTGNALTDFTGTKAVSKIIGRSTGYARKASVHIGVIYDWSSTQQPCYTIDVLARMMERIEDNIKRDSRYKAIINLPTTVLPYHRIGKELDLYTTLTPGERTYVGAYSRIADIVLKKFHDFLSNVILVTGTGDSSWGMPISEWPAKRGDTMSNLVVIGNADADGKINAFSEASYVAVYANTDAIEVPTFGIQSGTLKQYHLRNEKDSGAGFQQEYGIDLAIPIVTGILACIWSEGPDNLAQDVIETLYEDAYPRDVEGGLKIVWTGLRPTDTDTACSTKSNRKRFLDQCSNSNVVYNGRKPKSAKNMDSKTVKVTVTVTETTRVTSTTNVTHTVNVSRSGRGNGS
ncbi:hypothetical protein TWF696_002489 [Orbilia brochopaga]|uniref:Peptidase S8/S53 domain-containing protein n=1 Tax=Orbilia brochopaga TaxID=3140254 RepID=A0AAV9U4A0_9PEZI